MKNKIKGCLYGVAVGDALGACFEGWRPKDIIQRFGTSRQMEDFGTWKLGEFTDDTWLTLAAARAYESDKFDPEKAALSMIIWMRSNGRGIGRLTNVALSHISAGRENLFNAGKRAMGSMGSGRGAGNGSLMRCASTGCARDLSQLKDLVDESAVISEITHADPRCVGACVGYNIILSGLIDGRAPDEKVYDLVEQEIKSEAARSVFNRHKNGAGTSYDPADMSGMGYVLRALDASLGIIHEAINKPEIGFRKYMERIVNEGGDADTNAAIAGGLLGAFYGYDAIPKDWTDYLMWKDELDEATDLLFNFRKAK